MADTTVTLTAELRDELSAPLARVEKQVTQSAQRIEKATTGQSTAAGRAVSQVEAAQKRAASATSTAAASVERSASRVSAANSRAAGVVEASTGRMRDANGRFSSSTSSTASQVESQTSRIGGAFTRLGSSIGGWAQSVGPQLALAAGAVGAFMVKATGMAAEAEQNSGAIDSVFKNYGGKMHGYAAQAAQTVGLSTSSYEQLASVLGSSLKNGGMAIDQAGEKTNQLIGLGADLASMYGGTTAEAVQAFSSALRGETDPIERYGVSLSAAKVEAKAAEMGFQKMGGELSTQAKQAATLALIMEQTGDAHGNFAKESDTAAGAMQIAKARWEDAVTTLGTVFLPIMSKAAEVLADFARWVQENSSTVLILVGVLGGLALAVAAVNVAMWIMAANPVALTIGAIVLAIGGLVAGLIWAYNNVGWFRDMVDGAFKWVQQVVGAVVTWFTTVAMPWLGQAVQTLTPIFQAVINGIVSFWQNVLWPGIQTVIGFLIGLWNNVLLPAFRVVGNVFGLVIDIIVLVVRLGIRKAQDIFQGLVDFWNGPFGQGIRTVAGWIGDILGGAFTALSGPVDSARRSIGGFIDWLGSTVKNALDSFNSGVSKVRDAVGAVSGALGFASGGIVPVPHQGGYAAGGVLPGYSPGHDNMRFMTPGGTLDLAGGEAIMRPEFTRGVGADWIHRANAIATHRGAGAVRNFVRPGGSTGPGRPTSTTVIQPGAVTVNIGTVAEGEAGKVKDAVLEALEEIDREKKRGY